MSLPSPATSSTYVALRMDAEHSEPLYDFDDNATGDTFGSFGHGNNASITSSTTSGNRTKRTGSGPEIRKGKLASFWSQLRNLFRRNTGLLLIVASQAFLALVNVAVKKLNTIDPPVPTFELILIRMAITYLFSITYMIYTGVESPFLGPKGVRLLLMFRGFCGFFGIFGIYFALKYLSLSDATVLTFLSPLCTALAGALFLGEHVGRREIIAGVCSLLGVVFIARPTSLFGHGHVAAAVNTTASMGVINSTHSSPVNITALSNATFSGINSTLNATLLIATNANPLAGVTPSQRLIAVGVSLLGVLGSTGAYTTIRAIGKRAHALHSMVAFSGYSVVVSAIGLAVTRTPIVIPTSPLWLLLLLEIGVFGFCAQIFLTLGLQRETASRGTLAIYTLIVFTSFLDRIFFHAVPSLMSVSGTVVIVGSALWVVVMKEREGGADGGKETNGASGDREESESERGMLLKNLEEGQSAAGHGHTGPSQFVLDDEDDDIDEIDVSRNTLSLVGKPGHENS